MTAKCYYEDEDGNIICSDDYIFPEDIEYTDKNDWFRNAEEVYIEILKENTRYYNNYIRGKF